MIIGVDGNEANVEKQVGVSVYTRNHLAYFQKKAEATLQFRVFLKDRPSPKLPKENEWYRYVVIPGSFMWLNTSLPIYLGIKRDIDVFFAPAHYTPFLCPAPIVVTIHDLSFFYFPEEFLKKDLYTLTRWTKRSVQKARAVICVSETTKKDVLKFYQVAGEQIHVVYNGFETHGSKKTQRASSVIKRYRLKNKEYVLYVGTVQPRKNIGVLIDAFDLVRSAYPALKLVIAGKKGWLYDDIMQKVAASRHAKNITLTGFVEDEDLRALYQHAFCLVHPSLYEGFGLPLLEAMFYRCPVISSFASSLPEVGSDACLYFDPKDTADLAEKTITLLKEPDLRKELIRKGSQRVRSFSWTTSSEQTLEIIKKAARI